MQIVPAYLRWIIPDFHYLFVIEFVFHLIKTLSGFVVSIPNVCVWNELVSLFSFV